MNPLKMISGRPCQNSIRPCYPSRQDLYLFVVVISQQLVLVRVDNSIISSAPSERAPGRVPLPAPKARRNTPPQARSQERNGRQDGNQSAERGDRVYDPRAVLIEGAQTDAAGFAEPDAPEFAVPVSPDPIARTGGDADGDGNGEEQAGAAESAPLLLELFFLAGTWVGVRAEFELAPAGTRVQGYLTVACRLVELYGVGIFEADL